jgi:hypothetical protein
MVIQPELNGFTDEIRPFVRPLDRDWSENSSTQHVVKTAG